MKNSILFQEFNKKMGKIINFLNKKLPYIEGNPVGLLHIGEFSFFI